MTKKENDCLVQKHLDKDEQKVHDNESVRIRWKASMDVACKSSLKRSTVYLVCHNQHSLFIFSVDNMT